MCPISAKDFLSQVLVGFMTLATCDLPRDGCYVGKHGARPSHPQSSPVHLLGWKHGSVVTVASPHWALPSSADGRTRRSCHQRLPWLKYQRARGRTAPYHHLQELDPHDSNTSNSTIQPRGSREHLRLKHVETCWNMLKHVETMLFLPLNMGCARKLSYPPILGWPSGPQFNTKSIPHRKIGQAFSLLLELHLAGNCWISRRRCHTSKGGKPLLPHKALMQAAITRKIKHACACANACVCVYVRVSVRWSKFKTREP